MGAIDGMLEHNMATLEQVEGFIARGEDCCVVNPCGSGKSSVVAALMEAHPDKRFLILTKQKGAIGYYKGLGGAFGRAVIKTYQQALSDFRHGRQDGYAADYYILDEAHYLGAEKWGNAVQALIREHGPIAIGLTATPQRFADQGTERTIVGAYFGGNSAGNYTSADLQRAGVFQEPEYVLSLWSLEREAKERLALIEESGLPAARKQELSAMVSGALAEWRRGSSPEAVMAEALPRYMYKESCNRILVYVPRVSDISAKMEEVGKILRSIFPGKEVAQYRCTYQDPEDAMQGFLEEDGAYVKALYSIDKVMETIHFDDLCIAIMLRPSVSDRIIVQQFGRVNSIGNKRKPLVLDFVGNLQNIGGVSAHEEQGFPISIWGDGGAAHAGRPKGRPPRAILAAPISKDHASRYASIFAAVDGAIARTSLLSCMGYRGTLVQLCAIFGSDKDAAASLMADGLDAEDAVLSAMEPRGGCVTQAIFAGAPPEGPARLTDRQKEAVEERLPSFLRFLDSKRITDEDLRQDLFLEYCTHISRMPEDAKGGIGQYLSVRMNASYVKLCRHKRLRDGEFHGDGIRALDGGGADAWGDPTADAAMGALLRGHLGQALSTLKEREAKALMARYGFGGGREATLDEVGAMLGVTGTRASQILAGALRKMRHPKRSKPLAAFL